LGFYIMEPETTAVLIMTDGEANANDAPAMNQFET
jgi:hypothetical protein